MVGSGSATSWADTLAGVQHLSEAQARDKKISSYLKDDAALLELIKTHKQIPEPYRPDELLAWVENEKQLSATLAIKGFKSLDEYEQLRAAPWRAAFRERALEIAKEALRRAGESAEAMRKTARDRTQMNLMFDRLAALRQGTAGMQGLVKQVLTDYPILRHRKALAKAMRSPRSELGSRMGLLALQMSVATIDIQKRLDRDPERVFEWDNIVNATLTEMGFETNSPQAQAILAGIGEKRDESFLSVLLAIVDFLEYFIPGVGEVKAINFPRHEVDKYEGMARAWSTSAVRIRVRRAWSLQAWRQCSLCAAGPSRPSQELRGSRPACCWGPPVPAAVPDAPYQCGCDRAPVGGAAPHVETPPAPVTTEPPVARPAVDVEPPVAPKPSWRRRPTCSGGGGSAGDQADPARPGRRTSGKCQGESGRAGRASGRGDKAARQTGAETAASQKPAGSWEQKLARQRRPRIRPNRSKQGRVDLHRSQGAAERPKQSRGAKAREVSQSSGSRQVVPREQAVVDRAGAGRYRGRRTADDRGRGGPAPEAAADRRRPAAGLGLRALPEWSETCLEAR